MKIPPLAVIRLSLVLVIGALAAAIVGAIWSWNQAQAGHAELDRAHDALADARRQLDQSHEQKHLVVTHREAFETLRKRGFIGDENRLAWIEAAQHANRDAGLYGLDYRLTPRTPAPPELAHGLPLGQTRMTLTFPVLVETDLPRFLTALRQRAPGVFTVQSCRLSSSARSAFLPVNQPRMQAECDLLWFTVAQTAGAQP